MPLHLSHLVIPAPYVGESDASESDTPIVLSHELICGQHKGLIVEEIHFELCCRNDPRILNKMHRFEGLKTLCLDYVGINGDLYFPRKLKDLSRLRCPNLEHLAVWNVSMPHPIDLKRCPKLLSLHYKIRRWDTFYATKWLNTWSQGVLGMIKELQEYNVYICLDANETWSKMPSPQSACYRCCLDNKTEDIDPFAILRWLIQSVFFFADFYGLSSDPQGAVELDLRGIDDGSKLRRMLRFVRATGKVQEYFGGLWMRIQLDGANYVQIASFLPKNVRFLDIEFVGPKAIPAFITTDIVSSLPQLLELRIFVYHNGNQWDYARFTNSPFADFVLDCNADLCTVVLNPDQRPRGSVTAGQLEKSGNFITEVMGFFGLNPTLREIYLQFEGQLDLDPM
jgi:hypothetical protein